MIDLTAIYVANGFGLATLVTSVFCNQTLMSTKRRDIQYIWILLMGTLLACVVDPIVFTVDGKPGTMCHWLNILGNTYLHIASTWLSWLWIGFLMIHLTGYGEKEKKRIRWLAVVPAILTAVAVVNVVHPIIFQVGQDNVYVRLPMSIVFWIYPAVYMCYSVAVYLNCIHKHNRLLYFPIGVFILPILAGFSLQLVYYGLSLIWPATAVAIGGLLMSMKTEMAYVDQLTGINNRAFLFATLANRKISAAIMLDINGFKSINDTYGHEAGDKALIIVAEAIAAAASERGIAVRYAGDEFLVLSQCEDPATLDAICTDIRSRLDSVNQSKRNPYSLSISYGYTLDRTCPPVEDLIREADQNMYAMKAKYYVEHGDRRKR